MGLFEQAKKDIEQITSNQNEWGVPITFVNKDCESVVITGVHAKHHLGIDTDGNAVNAKKATISFSEKYLIDANYTIRNSANEVDLNGHRIFVKDSTGTTCQYQVQNVFPDETIGLITCTLEDYE